MLSPKDSCDTPICSDRYRDSVPILAAIAWSTEGPPAPRPVKPVQLTTPLIDLWWPLPGPATDAAGLSSPVITCMSSRNGAIGARQGVILYPVPVSAGIQ